MFNTIPIESRDREALRLQQCLAAAQGGHSAANSDEALLFRLAAQLVAPRAELAAVNLVRAAEGFERPADVAGDALRHGLIVSLPRFRERLFQQLGIPS